MALKKHNFQLAVLRIGCLVYAGFLGMVALLLLYLHEHALEQGFVHAQSHAEIMAEQTARMLDAADQRLALAQVRLDKLASLKTLDAQTARAVFQAELKDQPYLLDMWLLDTKGRIVYDTHPGTEGVDLSDRAFFTTHLRNADTGFFVDSPVRSRRTGQWQISVSRAWRAEDGALLGVVAASIDPRHFEDLWRDVSLTPGDSATLFTASGVMVMRSPFDAAAVGASFTPQPLFVEHLARAENGTFSARGSVDGERRLFAYQSIKQYGGLVVLVGLSYAAQLKPWTQLAWMVLVFVVLGSAMLVWLARALSAAWERNQQAYQKSLVSDHALRAISQGVLITGPDRLILAANQAFETITGYSEAELVGRDCKLLQGPQTNSGVVAAIRTALDAGLPFAGEVLNYRKDGTTFWNDLSISPVRDAGGVLTHFVGVQRDVTQAKLQQIQLHLTEQVFTQAQEGFVVTDAAENVIKVNAAFCAMSGYAPDELLGKTPQVWNAGLRGDGLYETMRAAIATQGTWAGEVNNKHKDGTVYPVWLTLSVIRSDQGQVTHHLGICSDLRRVKSAEDQVETLKHFDPLTMLPNRAALHERADQALEHARGANEAVCLLLVSIDNFKALNDTLGHRVGDKVLLEVADRLRGAVRAQDTVSHQMGKEFTLMLPGTRAETAAQMASELLWQLAQPLSVANQSVSVTCSMGVAVYPEHGSDFEALVHAAHVALHRAQALGRNDFQFYSAEVHQEALQREQMTKALRGAVTRGELQVVYQPLADMESGKISGMEALLRWTNPDLGAVPPAVFIPVAEQTGLIVGIGEWVLRQVCADVRSWVDEGIAVPHVAVNVSSVQFRDPDFMQTVELALSDHAVPANQLYLEVTESALIDDVQRCEALLNQLKQMGFGLSLDDFGTGYSSLSYLKRYPFSKVKIDQSFVRDIGSNEADLVIVKVIISMAHGLGLKVIAEGVETEAQCEIMRTNVCDEIQGYFFSRPVDANSLKGLLLDNKQLPPHLLRFRAKQRTLLLVDDEPNVLAALRRLFRRDGYTIVTANSGAEGLEALAQNKVDLIISDQRMPGMTGVEFLREAKRRYPDTIRIVLSGYTELQSVTDAINEGSIYRFLTKPWDDAQLREHIRAAFDYKELQDDNQQLDIKIRVTNQELAASNRQLGEVIETTRQQVEMDSNSLAIAREALELIPMPVLGVDEEGVVTFANPAAESLLHALGGMLGVELVHVSQALSDVLSSSPQGNVARVQLGSGAFDVCWSAMGRHSRSRGKLITMISRETP